MPDCLYIERLRFPSDQHAERYIEQCESREEDHIWQGMVFKRQQVGEVVLEYHYMDAPLKWIENMFQEQMNATDALLTGTKKLGTTTMGGGMTTAVGMLDGCDQDY